MPLEGLLADGLLCSPHPDLHRPCCDASPSCISREHCEPQPVLHEIQASCALAARHCSGASSMCVPARSSIQHIFSHNTPAYTSGGAAASRQRRSAPHSLLCPPWAERPAGKPRCCCGCFRPAPRSWRQQRHVQAAGGGAARGGQRCLSPHTRLTCVKRRLPPRTLLASSCR